MPATLLVKPLSGEPFEVEIGNTATIGRTPDNNVALTASPRVSRQHAVIRCNDGVHYQLIDLGSTNGTYVANQRVVMPCNIEPGEVIRIGCYEIVLRQAEKHHAEETMLGSIADNVGPASSEVADVALLVCDIRGFSTVAEKTESGNLAKHLGGWFRDAGQVIHASRGVIDKFIGDAILAYWIGRESPSECDLALQTARELLDVASGMTWPGSTKHLRIAVALHYGRVTCGNIGLDATRDATIIGDAVNTVFRMETLSKTLDQPLIYSQDFQMRLASPSDSTDLGTHTVKGKSNAIRVFGLDGK